MHRGTATSSYRDSFLDVLRSEIIAGSENLASWIAQVHNRGAIDGLFGMETWLKGIRSFFNLENLPLGNEEKADLLNRNFAWEIKIVRQAVQICEAHACRVMEPENNDKVEFEQFIENQMRKARILDFHISRIVEQMTPWDSISQLLESLNDFRITIDALKEKTHLDYQLFLSLGRCYRRELQNCRYIDMLMSQRFRMQYDHIENKYLTDVLRSIPDNSFRRNAALAFLYLFRFLKYLGFVSLDLKRDRPLRQNMVIFSLLHEEMGNLSDFLKAHFIKAREIDGSLRSAAGLIAYSLQTESQRVINTELVSMSREMEPANIYARMENSHGLLSSCCQSAILTLAQAIDKSFDATVLFPFRAEHLATAEKLRKDLWELRQWMADVLQNREELDTSRIIARFTSFKDTSLRFLMYRDWHEFESFLDALTTTSSFIEIRTRMRKFVSFLEALIQEVSKRSVFRDSQSRGQPAYIENPSE